jgi:hypothetical protein
MKWKTLLGQALLYKIKFQGLLGTPLSATAGLYLFFVSVCEWGNRYFLMNLEKYLDKSSPTKLIATTNDRCIEYTLKVICINNNAILISCKRSKKRRLSTRVICVF